jgi:hypothetical protein
MDDEDNPRLEDLPPLGPTAAWLVKGFPVSLREDITRAAAGQGVTVGAWLIGHFQKFGVGGVEITKVYPPPVNSGNAPGTALAVVREAALAGGLDDLREIAAIAKDLAAVEATAAPRSQAKGIANRVSSLLRHRLDGMKPVNAKADPSGEDGDGLQDTA